MTYLQKIDPDRNMHRFYRATVAPTLFGEWALIREWGRIGSPKGRRLYIWFPDETSALSAYQKILMQKARRGYLLWNRNGNLATLSSS
jgi:predicted DNA-binding WGR domain protein